CAAGAGGNRRRRAGAARAPVPSARGRSRGSRRGRARAPARGAPPGQRAPARRHDRAPEVGARRIRSGSGGGDVEGQARRRRLRRRARAADRHERDGLHGALRGRSRVQDPPPPQQSGADPAHGRGGTRARAAVLLDHTRARRRSGARGASDAMSSVAVGPELPPDVDRQLEGLPAAELAVGVLTYNNAATVPAVMNAVHNGLEKHFAGTPAVLINADAGSSDATVERLSGETRWPEPGRSVADLWIAGIAVADGLAIHEARLGRWRVESSTRTTDLPTMVAQTLGAVFAVMEEYEDLWLATASGLPVPT